MKLAVAAVGKIAYAPFQEAVSRYAQRLTHYLPFEIKEFPDIKNTKALTPELQKVQEGALLIKWLAPNDQLILMDERGKEYTSRAFSQLIAEKMHSVPGRLVFAIGGPYGFSPEVYARANGMISLSKMTFPHELARVILVEQLYRAMTIQRGEPYHHD
ncbi:MAG: 23S rRNA (pseudouridine(1915)-N(3))-methyltransferase RlmH [Bacteroidales bacterium]|nr:23S rRNA (pseudouridine(1915)-N(3))-methyltransferase RlmH [Bacteroidales bacterium]